jgi:hypothetical protein
MMLGKLEKLETTISDLPPWLGGFQGLHRTERILSTGKDDYSTHTDKARPRPA